MKRIFEKGVNEGLRRAEAVISGTITEDDLQQLPDLVQKYLRYTGVVGKEKVLNMQITFSGRLRGKPSDGWMKLAARQYSFFDCPTRVFYLKARMKGIPVTGLHYYKNGEASMQVKVLSLFPVIDAKGDIMNQSETVTFFNDMCCMAPATLINPAIRWEIAGELSVKAYYNVNGITISAVLYFNEAGQLINFSSDDRYCYMPDKTFRLYRWTTPIEEYKNCNGFNLPSFARAIWSYPEGEFCYGEFVIKRIDYNCSEFI